jgi:hypothetical protein
VFQVSVVSGLYQRRIVVSKPFTQTSLRSAGGIVAALVGAAVIMVAVGSARSHGPRGTFVANSAATATKPAASPVISPVISEEQRSRVRASLGALPLAFEENQGQSDPQVRYMARGNGYKLLLTSSQAVLRLTAKGKYSEVLDMMLDKRRGAAGTKAYMKKRGLSPSHDASMAVVRMNLGVSAETQLTAEDLQPGKVNYFVGNNRANWRSNIPLYGRVSYKDVYPGVDIAFHGVSRRLEFDYLVSPGTDPACIALSFEGTDGMHTNAAGDLVLATTAGPVELHKPIAYQSKNGTRELVDARFVVKDRNRVAFEVGAYDHSRELVIDPAVTYSTYFGGNDSDYGISIAVDTSGNAYVAGATDSSSIPGWSSAPVGGFDTFVTKLNSAGALQFTTEFGGSADDFPGGVAIDGQGIYVGGTTDSADFPITTGAAQTTPPPTNGTNGNNGAYAVKLSLTGTLAWGTYIDGSDSTSGLGVAIDSSHNVYVVGETFAPDLAGGVVNPLPNGSAINLGSGSGDDDGYVVKVTNPSGTSTSFALVSYIGGSNGDLATGVALDGNGNIHVVGETISTDFPVTAGVVQPQCGTDGTCNGGQDDAFAVSIEASLAAYNYVTYYGGSSVDDGFAIAADANGNAFLTGRTQSSDFPTAGTPFQSALAGTQNAFIVELNSSGTTATYGSYLGGNGTDLGLGITLDASDNVYVTGQTSSSSSFPLLNPTQGALSGPTDAFVTVLGLSQNQLLFSTYLGGSGDEDQLEGSIGVDGSENIYVTGDTDSGNGTTTPFPTTSSAIDGTYAASVNTCTKGGLTVPCPTGFIAAYTQATTPNFAISATALSPASVSPGSSATSTISVTPLNAYSGTVNLTCLVTGSGAPLPTCALSPTSGNSSTLTVSTTGASAALNRRSNVVYAMCLPVVGLSLVGMSFSTKDSRKKKLLGFLLLGVVMAMLFFLPACGGGSSGGGGGGGGGCSGCTPAGNYTVTVTGTDSVNANLTHTVSPALTLTVN